MINKKKGLLIFTAGVFALFLLLLITPTFSITKEEANNYYYEDLTSSEYAQMFRQVFQHVLDNYVDEIPPEQLFEGAMKGLFESVGDPHTAYLTPSQIMDLNDTTSGEFGGLGIHIQKQVVGLNSESKSNELPYVKIISPIHGTPAFRKGLKAGDYITHIEGESTIDLTSDDVLKRLRGKKNTDVTITILRDRTVSFDVTITRAIIQIPSERHAIIDNIGYLQLIQFTNHTPAQVRKVFNEFLDNDVKGIIIDVRNNPGGLLQAVLKVSDYIFEDGVIVSTKSRIFSENAVYRASSGKIIPEDLPLVILTNAGSASASEILTGVLKDRGRATVIGTKTFGKGSVQNINPVIDGAYKMTIARFYSPSGKTIDQEGIEPHIIVEEKTIADLSEDETIEYIKLLEERVIGNHLLENEDMEEKDVISLTDTILDQGYGIPRDFLANEIRHRVNRNRENPEVYDIVNDKPLIKAIEVLSK